MIANTPADAPSVVPVARDAGSIVHVAHVDAGIADAASVAVVTGTATLRLGASPWGEVYIDGKHVGRAPHDFPVSAGHHEIKIEFPAESPMPVKAYSVDISAGETQSLMADFQH